jgi:hypothetical protein
MNEFFRNIILHDLSAKDYKLLLLIFILLNMEDNYLHKIEHKCDYLYLFALD